MRAPYRFHRELFFLFFFSFFSRLLIESLTHLPLPNFQGLCLTSQAAGKHLKQYDMTRQQASCILSRFVTSCHQGPDMNLFFEMLKEVNDNVLCECASALVSLKGIP